MEKHVIHSQIRSRRISRQKRKYNYQAMLLYLLLSVGHQKKKEMNNSKDGNKDLKGNLRMNKKCGEREMNGSQEKIIIIITFFLIFRCLKLQLINITKPASH